jgi:hypothetical protein
MGYVLVLSNTNDWRNLPADTMYIDCDNEKPTADIVTMILFKYRDYKFAHLIKGKVEFRKGKRGFSYDDNGHISTFGPLITNVSDISKS